MNSIKQKLDLYFSSRLTALVPSVPFLTAFSDGEATTPYAVFSTVTAQEQVPGSAAYLCEARLVLITHMNETPVANHDSVLNQIIRALDRIPRQDQDEILDLYLFGFTFQHVSPTDIGENNQARGDVVLLLIGASG